MKNVDGLAYFAYGSNLSVSSMELRCPAASKIGRARLDDWRLTFRGVADVEKHDGVTVEGGLWDITPSCLRSLDSYEGAPHLYDRAIVNVQVRGIGTVKAFTYIMVSHLAVGLPSPYYYNIIKEGFRDFGIDEIKLEDALEVVRKKHAEKAISHYEAVGPKRLMAVLEEDLEDIFEEDEDPDITFPNFYDGMTPATRMLYNLECKPIRMETAV